MFRKNKEAPQYREEITIDQIEKFLAIHGQRGALTLSFLGKKQVFVDAISSEIGQIILHSVMVRMEKLLNKIIDLKANDKEKIEFKILKDIFQQWANEIVAFEQKKKEIQEVSV